MTKDGFDDLEEKVQVVAINEAIDRELKKRWKFVAAAASIFVLGASLFGVVSFESIVDRAVQKRLDQEELTEFKNDLDQKLSAVNEIAIALSSEVSKSSIEVIQETIVKVTALQSDLLTTYEQAVEDLEKKTIEVNSLTESLSSVDSITKIKSQISTELESALKSEFKKVTGTELFSKMCTYMAKTRNTQFVYLFDIHTDTQISGGMKYPYIVEYQNKEVMQYNEEMVSIDLYVFCPKVS